MPWYGWFAIGSVALLGALLVAVLLLRRTDRGRRFLQLSSRAKLRFVRALLRNPDTPLPARILLVLLLGYLLLPFDLIPDFIPVIGQVDDLLAVAGVLVLLLVIVPGERLDAALAEAEGTGGG